MIAAMLERARKRDDFVAATRALDRVLLSGFYVVPLYYPPVQWVARWTRIKHPAAHLAVRLSAGNLVAGGMIASDHRQPRGRRPRRRSTTCSAAPACARRRRAGADRSARPRALHRRRAARLTYAQADRAISALAARLRALGLRPTPWSACSCPTRSRASIALLGVLRAGMIAAPLPLLWRQQDMVAALGASAPRRSSARAMRQPMPRCRRRPSCFRSATSAASATTCPTAWCRSTTCFAPAAPTVSRFAAAGQGRRACRRRHLRRHRRRHRSGRAQPCATSSPPGAIVARGGSPLRRHRICCRAIVPGTFAAIALGIVPWLLTGGTLALHQPFDAANLAAQCDALGACAVVLPGPAAAAAVRCRAASTPSVDSAPSRSGARRSGWPMRRPGAARRNSSMSSARTKPA